MKVYLFNPPASKGIKMVREGRCMQREGAWSVVWPPVSLTLPAAILEHSGFEVRVNDCGIENVDEKRFKKILEDFKPDLAIINTATASIDYDLSMAKLIKSVSSKTKTATIGIHVTVLPEECLKIQSELDYVIRGEPEITVYELAKALRDKKDISAVDGVSFRREGKVIHNKTRKFIEDLDSLPFPAWHLINPHNYLVPMRNKPFLLLTTSKGCPYHCTFCPAKPYYGAKMRLRDQKKVVDEIEYIIEKYKVNNFLIWSELFTYNKDFVIEFCNEILKRKIDVEWICNSRVDTVDLETLKKMKEAGCWMIGYGIESGNQEILDKAHKGITLEQIENAVELAKKAGLEITAHVIFGLPGETKKTGLQTIKFIKKLDVDFGQFYCVVPWPGTQLYNIMKKEGRLVTTDWSMFEQNYSVINLDTITAGEVMALRRKALRKFYTSPKIIIKTLRKIRSFEEFKNFALMVRRFLTWV